MFLGLSPGTRWLLTQATARGKSHAQGGLPNQDCVEVMSNADASVIAAVICDGAGTARHSEVGARTTCQALTPALMELGARIEHAPMPLGVIRKRIIEVIERVRTQLSALGPLNDYHCTLVMCLLTERCGYLGQVGDSIGLSTRFQYISDGTQELLDFFPSRHVRVFEPSRGEYANETHFITQPEWTSSLRLVEIDPSRIDALLLMTDGAMDVAMRHGRPFRGFLANLLGNLLAMDDAQERNQLLAGWLSDPQTHPVTGDDKTMFLAIPDRHRSLANEEFLNVDPVEEPLSLPGLTPWERFLLGVREHKVRLAFSVAALLIAFSVLFGQLDQAMLAFDVDEPARSKGRDYITAELSLVRGKGAEVKKVSDDPSRSLRLLAHRGACQSGTVLTEKVRTCTVWIAPGIGIMEDNPSLRVVYRDTDSGKERELLFEVPDLAEISR
jgi:serine/threonine protein phosphatase PrpC